VINLIILNGTSSSGKTTIAKVFQNICAEPYTLLTMDNFLEMSPKRNEPLKVLEISLKSMMYSVASFLYNKSNVIVDIVFYDIFDEENKNSRVYLDMLDEALDFYKIKQQIKITMIKVDADEDILLEREILRNDRHVGLVKMQKSVIHNNIIYDLELDTSKISPIKNAQKIIKKVYE
jgi:chloramphenicol 3-O phosphotransferase